MNTMFFATFLCMAAFASASWVGGDDGQWRGEGLAESQDHGQWNGDYLGATYAGVYSHGYGDDGQWRGEGLAESQDHSGAWNYLGNHVYGGVYAHGAAPIGHDGRVVDTPEVAHAKSAHFAAVAAASHGAAAWAPAAYTAWAPAAYTAWGPATYGVPQVPHDTPEVAHAKAQHFAAHAAAAHRW